MMDSQPENRKKRSRIMNSSSISKNSKPVLERPELYGKVSRSIAWGVLKEMLKTQKQFDDTATRAATAISGFIKDDSDSQKAALKYFQDGPGKLRESATDWLALNLAKPPTDKTEESFFDIEDTSCTKDSPEKPDNDNNSGGDGGQNTEATDDKSDSNEREKEPVPADGLDPLKCHGVGGDVWMIHRDQAVSAAEQFCAQDSREKEYFQGSVDQVKLILSNADSAKSISEMPNCVDKFKLIIDSCDGNDPTNNPHNYKFGGTYTDSSSGWELKLEPLARKATENSGDITYKFTHNKFEVRGKNFPDGKLGANGGGLKEEIKGCGALTAWKFKWTPDDVTYQWYASGNLPVGTRSCVGAATQTAGGKKAGHCKGPG
ncbi:MAG: hypothetical protein Q9213_004061 [Squamulea squamosa]